MYGVGVPSVWLLDHHLLVAGGDLEGLLDEDGHDHLARFTYTRYNMYMYVYVYVYIYIYIYTHTHVLVSILNMNIILVGVCVVVCMLCYMCCMLFTSIITSWPNRVGERFL